MNRTKLLTIAVIGLLLVNLGTLAFLFLQKGHHPPHMPMHGPGGPDGPGPRGEGPKRIIIERLNFDDAQQKQYESIIEEHRTKMHELNEEGRDLHNELFAQLKENAIDTVKKNLVITKIAGNQKALDELNFDHFQKIKAICKGDQLEKFNGLVQDLTHLFGHKGPPHGPRPGRRPE